MQQTIPLPAAAGANLLAFPANFDQLLADPYLLARAWRLVRRGGPSAGVDGVTVAQFEQDAKTRLAALSHQLQRRPYRAGRLRSVFVPKVGGGRRELSIPTVADRIVQQAIRLLLDPRLEPRFHSSSYAYRPERDAHQATDQLTSAIGGGLTWVVETDIERFFDSIRHPPLLDLLTSWGLTGQGLRVVRRVVRSNSSWWPRRRGVPQGSPLSPLLANAYLTPFDELLAHWGLTAVRYADDLVLLCPDQASAETALACARRAAGMCHLRLHARKTRIVDSSREPFEFLGFRHAPEFLWPTRDNLSKFEREILSWTDPARGCEDAARLERIKQLVRAFAYYYHACDVSGLYRRLDGLLAGRLEALSRQLGEPRGAWWREQMAGVPRLSGLRQQYLRARRRRPVRWDAYEASGLRRRDVRAENDRA